MITTETPIGTMLNERITREDGTIDSMYANHSAYVKLIGFDSITYRGETRYTAIVAYCNAEGIVAKETINRKRVDVIRTIELRHLYIV